MTGLMTTKNWSFVKATVNSTIISGLVHLDDSYKSSPLDQAKLFYRFFYKQFYETSSYNISVDNSNSQEFFYRFWFISTLKL